jgi:hypothetical protein
VGLLILMSRESVRAGEFIREKEQINIQARLSRKARLERPLHSAKICERFGS